VTQPAPPPRRRLLGTAHTLSERVRIYWTPEALEVDRLDHYEIRRRRVFFDEVLLVTLHAGRTALSIVFPLLMVILFGLLALGAWTEDPTAGRVLLVITALFTAWALTAMALPVWIVTVYGKRTRARMHFRLKQRKAREVYAEICRAASDAQRAVAARLAAEAPAPPLPSLPLSDSEPQAPV
jgi:hypothetical protein